MASKRYPALRSRDFRLFWIGQMLSMTGSQMQIVALNWHIYILTNSPIALGMIGLMRFIPIVLFSLVGGSVADAFNRKKVMFVAQVILIIISSLLALQTFTGQVNEYLIYIITILSAIAFSFDMPSRQAIVPRLVQRRDLANAMSMMSIGRQLATIVGPAIAGMMIAHVNIGSVYATNAISYVAVIISLFLMRTSGKVDRAGSPLSLAAIKEGIRFVKAKTIIWSTMLLDFFSTFFSTATALLPIFAKDILHVGPQGLGFLYAAESLGAVLAGAFLAHTGTTLRKQGKILLLAVSLYGLATVIFGLSKNFVLSFLALMLVGVGDSISSIIRNTIRQIATPDHIRGRMSAINMMFFMGGPQFGEFEAGLLAAMVGAPLSVVLGGIATLGVVGIMSLKIPILRRYDVHEKESEVGI